MINGITITQNQDGIVVNGDYCLVYGDAKDVVSKYFFYNYWDQLFAPLSEGEISPDSLFIKYVCYAPLPCASGFTIFPYCHNPKFAAGYLKFVVLCEFVRCVLLEIPEAAIFLNPKSISFDMDDFIEKYEPEDSRSKEICERIKHILRLCNLVFLEQDNEEAKKLLFSVADKFNEYFSEVYGWDFEFKVYDGASKAKDEILSFISTDSDREFVSSVMSRDIWKDEEKQSLVDILESLAG